MLFVSPRAHTAAASTSLLVLLVTAFGTSAPAFADMSMHKALYELRTISSSSNSPVAHVRGTMSYEWADACEGWVVDQRYKLQFQYRDGPGLEMINNFLAWESKDGMQYEFKARKFIDGALDEEIDGRAAMSPLPSKASFTLPESAEMELSRGTMFPVTHTLELISLAQQGKRFFYKTVFDGSMVDAGSDISAVIGQARNSAIDPEKVKGDRELLRGKMYPITMAYFDKGDGSGVPKYELTVQLLENGVAERLVLNYGDYVLDATLSSLEKLPASGC